jgi:hypothetical protein
MQRAGEATKQFSKVNDQQVVETVNGILTGVKLSLIQNSVLVTQEIGVAGKRVK